MIFLPTFFSVNIKPINIFCMGCIGSLKTQSTISMEPFIFNDQYWSTLLVNTRKTKNAIYKAIQNSSNVHKQFTKRYDKFK